MYVDILRNICYYILVARERQERSPEMEKEEMTKAEFKTLMEMVILILEGCKTKEEALEKLKNLSIFKEN